MKSLEVLLTFKPTAEEANLPTFLSLLTSTHWHVLGIELSSIVLLIKT